MASGGLSELQDGIGQRLAGLVSRGRSASAYFNRTLLQEFKDKQNERWQTENASQTGKWAPLSPLYARQKKKRFAGFPGGGNALMVATGRLAQGAQGINSGYYYKTVTDRSFIFGVNLGALPYAKYPGVRRPFMSFSEDTISAWRRGVGDYIMKGQL